MLCHRGKRDTDRGNERMCKRKFPMVTYKTNRRERQIQTNQARIPQKHLSKPNRRARAVKNRLRSWLQQQQDHFESWQRVRAVLPESGIYTNVSCTAVVQLLTQGHHTTSKCLFTSRSPKHSHSHTHTLAKRSNNPNCRVTLIAIWTLFYICRESYTSSERPSSVRKIVFGSIPFAIRWYLLN